MRRRSCAADANPPAAGLGASLRWRPGRCRTSRRGSPPTSRATRRRRSPRSNAGDRREHSVSSGEAGALDLADRAYRLLEGIDDPKLQVEIASTLVTTLIWSGHHDRLRDLFVESVAQYPTAPVRKAGKIAQKFDFSFCSAVDASSTFPSPPALVVHHQSRMIPPSSSSGAAHDSRCLMPSRPVMMK